MSTPQINIRNLTVNMQPPGHSPALRMLLGGLASAAAEHASRTADKPADRFGLAHDDQVVIDNETGLMWSRDTIGGEVNWVDAKKAAAQVAIGGHDDWRLPTIKELLSIVDYERSNPAIDTGFFNVKPTYYWSSTPSASSSVYAWFVGFNNGDAPYYYRQNYKCLVRAVRRARPVSQSSDLC